MNRNWRNVRERLLKFPEHFNSSKTVELLDLCVNDKEIKALEPCISLGRLCLRVTNQENLSITEYGCLYFHKDCYGVSTYDNHRIYYFKEKEDAIDFLKKEMPLG